MVHDARGQSGCLRPRPFHPGSAPVGTRGEQEGDEAQRQTVLADPDSLQLRRVDVGHDVGQLQFGRESPGGKAVTMVNVDSAVEESTLAELRALPHVISVTKAYL